MTGGLIQIPMSIDRTKNTPLQVQLAEGIRNLILQDTIRPNMRLPASRALSRHLGVSRNTVKIAYQNLISEGYLQSNGANGTYVCPTLPDALMLSIEGRSQSGMDSAVGQNTPPLKLPRGQPFSRAANTIDFSLQNVDPNLAPERTWRRLMIQHLPYRTRHAGNNHPAGLEILREAIVNSVSPLRGMSVAADDSIIVSDEYRAIDIISRVMIKPGTRVAIEDPCDEGLRYLLKNQGACIIPIPVDKEGIDVDRVCGENVQIIFVSPSHQQPTGITLQEERRHQLLNWAIETGGYIVERDTFGEFFYDDSPIPSLFSLCSSDQVIYVNSFSSWIGAGMQLCYCVLPNHFVEPFLKIKTVLSTEPAWLDQRVAAEFISSDGFFGHLRRVRHQLKNRRDEILAAINESMDPQEVSGQQAGRHLVWHIPDNATDAQTVRKKAAMAGINIPTLRDGYSSTLEAEAVFDSTRTLLLGYAVANEETLRKGVVELAKLISPANKQPD